MNRDDLKRALIGIEPLPMVTVEGVGYARQHSGDWTWHHPRRPGHAHDCVAPKGSRKANELEQLLASQPT